MSDVVSIWTDGACSGNPGPGGWGAILVWKDHEKLLSGSDKATTNNRMELMGAISGLEALKKPTKVHLHTDSQYVKNGITSWIAGWKRKGWKTAAGSPVANVDLWQRLEKACEPHDIAWFWVRGHNGDEMNERVDALAREAIVALKAGR